MWEREWLRVSVIAVVAAAVIYLTLPHERPQAKSQSASRVSSSQITAILQRWTRDLFSLITELAMSSSRIRSNLHERNISKIISEEQLHELILEKGFRQQLDEVKSNVLKEQHIEMAVEEFECLVEERCEQGDVEVRELVEGLQKMSRDALYGVLPTFPGQEIPEMLTPKVVLDIFEETLEEKRKTLEAMFKEQDYMINCIPTKGVFPTADLSDKILEISQQVEADVLQKHKESLGDLDDKDLSIAFRNSIAHYCRQDIAFKQRKELLSQLHTDTLIEIMNRSLNAADESKLGHSGAETKENQIVDIQGKEYA